jgi:PIN domain nuclease of toxin-antitoxin system
MRYLLDTHVLLWAAFETQLLSTHAKELIQASEHELLISAASAWEIATKYRLGRLPFARALVDDFVRQATHAGFLFLSISVEHALRAGRLPGDHKDPFDRMLAAQAIHEDIAIISNDAQLDLFGVRREW